MNFKKTVSLFIVLYFGFFSNTSFADDYIDDNVSNIDFEINVSSDLSNIPTLNARCAVVFERDSNVVLFGKNENEQCKMASTTKIMTAIVVLENCNDLQSIVTISKKAARNRRF